MGLNPQTMTDEQIHQLGICESTWSSWNFRFLQQYGTGGNYAADRHQWLSEFDVKTLVKQIQQAREEKVEERCV